MYEMEGPHRFPASLTALPIARVRLRVPRVETLPLRS